MPPYNWIHLENFIFMAGVGIGLALLIILARGSEWFAFSFKKQSERELDQNVHEFGGGVKERTRPVPVFMWVVIMGYLIWAVGYVVYCRFYGV